MNNFVCYQFEAIIVGFDRVVGNCDQIYLRVAHSNRRMGKMIAISF